MTHDNSVKIFNSEEMEELDPAKSLFLTPSSRGWAKHLQLKVSIASALLLLIAFIFSFFTTLIPTSNLLLLFVFFLAGTPALIDAIEDILNWDINIDILMTLAAFLSLWMGDGFEGGLLLVLFSISGAIEHSVLNKAKGALFQLNELSPKKAHVLHENGKILECSIFDIPVGTTILVKAGELVPLDGEILEGTSSLDLSHLTGEHLPVRKSKGETIPAGGKNLEGALTVKVTQTCANSTLSRIIHLITEAQDNKPKLQRWIDKVSTFYASTIILLALLFACILPLLFHIPYLGEDGSIQRALSFLIAASPCAVIIAIPIAYLSALSACAKKGILVKGSVVLDALDQCEYIAFDKTGTLTEGTLTCSNIDTKEDTNYILSLAYALERNVVHPIAKAIALKAESQNVPLLPIEQFESVPGEGLQAYIEGAQVYIGRPEFILPKVNDPKLEEQCKKTLENGTPLTILAVHNKWAIFHFSDKLRPDMKTAITNLKKRKKIPLMLTGDHYKSAYRVARSLELEKFQADLSPEDKLQHVSELSKTKGLAMVGDGVNDAPALARATVGIAMGGVGSSTSIDVSDIVLLNDETQHLPWLFQKAHKTGRILKQNLFFAGGVIVCVSLLALLGIVPLWLAVILHEGGTVAVGLNGLRLLAR
jgi:Cd2+/Zn2+-exporting ATPase